jgi:chromosome segregation ATPase
MSEPNRQYHQALSANRKLLEEVALLKAEVEHLTSELKMEKENEDRIVRLWQTANNEVHGQATQIAALIDNQTHLKAEVESLTEGNECLDNMHEKEMARSAYLCEQVERLRKAGDELERVLTNKSGSYEAGNASHEWQSAKNYKPSV